MGFQLTHERFKIVNIVVCRLVWEGSRDIGATSPTASVLGSGYSALFRQPLFQSSTHSHLCQVSLPNPRTLSHKSSSSPRTCNLWNVLPSSCFPESYNLPSFKSKINELDMIPLSLLLAFRFLLSSFVEALYRPPWPFPNITQ